MSSKEELQNEKEKWQEAMKNPKAKKVSFLTWLIDLVTCNKANAEQEYQYQRRNSDKQQ